MGPVIWWGLLAVVLFTLEVATASFFFLWIGAGALLTALSALFLDMPWAQVGLFVGSSILLVAASRRWAARLSGKAVRLANVDSLVGQTGRVTKRLKGPQEGYATIGGEAWRVETLGGEPLEPGDQVRVKEVRSNHLVVEIVGQD